MKIVHIPSWYPTRNNPIEGIFNQRLIYSINEFDDNEHIVFTWQHNQMAKIREPISFFLSLFKSLLPFKMYRENGVQIVRINYLVTNEVIFGKNINRLIRKIDSALQDLKLNNATVIYHAHVSYPGAFVAHQLNVLSGAPYLVTEHMGPFPFDDLCDDLINKVIIPISHAERVIAVSTFLAGQVEDLVGVRPHVIPNVVQNISTQESICNKESGLFRFVVVSRITKEKGIGVLLEAIDFLQKNRTDFSVDIYGDGPMKEYFMEYVERKKYRVRVNINDSLKPETVQRTMQGYDIVVSPSLYESFGVTLIEALSVGRPIIATDCGGPIDIVNEINGILIPKNNPVQLAYAMNSIMNTYEKYNQVRILEDCLKRFSSKVISEKYNILYKEIIQG